jgi:osmoprotectant transport system substrate-binding protein
MTKGILARRVSFLLAPLLLLLFLPGCASIRLGSPGVGAAAAVRGDGAVTIGSFDFPESSLLAEIYAQALEAKGFKVKRAFDLGPRELVEPAIERQLVEFVPEYLGTAIQFITRGTADVSPDVEVTRRKLMEALYRRGISVMASSPAQDANAIAVTPQTAAKYGLKTISDLIPVAGHLVFGGPPECPSRPLCLLGLQTTYGLTFGRFVALDAGGPLTSAELDVGLIDVGLLFTTDWQIRANGFVVLDDDRGMQPAENVTPIVRNEVVAAYGTRFTDVVDAVSARLTTEVLQQLNGQVSLQAKPAAAVAAAWLRSAT